MKQCYVNTVHKNIKIKVVHGLPYSKVSNRLVILSHIFTHWSLYLFMYVVSSFMIRFTWKILISDDGISVQNVSV